MPNTAPVFLHAVTLPLSFLRWETSGTGTVLDTELIDGRPDFTCTLVVWHTAVSVVE